MTEQDHINYHRIAQAIAYIQANFKKQPDLEEVAEKLNLSPYHFQRIFTEWAGTSPKKFLQYISVGYAKKLLKENQLTLFDAAFHTGLSGTGRLHDLFVKIEGMTPAEYKNGGKTLTIRYSFAQSPFGKILVASTDKGVCHLAFAESETEALHGLTEHFPNAHLHHGTDAFQENTLKVFTQNGQGLEQVKLHLKGTEFQLKVWEALLKIPMGRLSTYGAIALQIENPRASRAVGSAIGDNPVAYLIPCHRVIQSSGVVGGYMWGPTRKTAMIGWESSKIMEEQRVS